MTPLAGRLVSRRAALSLGVAGAAGLALAACGGSGERPVPAAVATPAGAGPGLRWAEPPVLHSLNGLLDVTLKVASGLVPGAASSRWAVTVNGTSPGPTLRVKPGDRLRIVLDNQLDHSTNIHTHGLRVSPTGNADNPFIEVKAGERFAYEIDLPADHPSGLFWYHPHLHHHVAEQLFAGMFGAIVVEDAIDQRPEIAAMAERLMLLHDTRDAATEAGVTTASAMEQRDGRQGDLILINGGAKPVIEASSDRLERWRLLNASASRFYRLKLEGHELNVIARDGGRLAVPDAVSELVIVPGERVEVVVQPGAEGVYRLSSLPVNRGAMVASTQLELATFQVGAGSEKAPGLPATLANVVDAATMKVTGTREVTLEMQTGGGPPRFLVSGKVFDAARIDTRVKLGTVEDWVVRNVGPMDHPFHLHIWPFQVVEQSAAGTPPRGWKDVVNVPAGGFVRIRIPFEKIGGKTVYHCHILDHEDLGMMAVIEAT